MTSQTISVRLSKEKVEALMQISETWNHSRNQTITAALDNYIEMNQSWKEGIEKAIASDDAGLSKPATEVLAEIENEVWK